MGFFDFFKKKKVAPTTMPESKPHPQNIKPPVGPPSAPAKVQILTPPAPPTTPTPPAPPAPSTPLAPKTVTAPGEMRGKKIKYHYDRVRVFTPKELGIAFDKLNPGDVVTLKRDPQNQYDQKAVMVVHPSMGNIGYLNKCKIYDMANDYLLADCPIYAHIDSVDDDERKLTLFMAFYGSTLGKRSKTYKLTGTGSQAAQDAILCISEDDTLPVEYDAEKDRYEVYSMGDRIGYLPKAANAIAEGKDECIVATLDENGKTDVYVCFEE